ncbi:hypothetical protein lerEdw1_019821 [Lerista edwardsae]|nr:hypothetical protein lerEdw1_019821 [Lerista edwardsae]
MSVRVMLQRFLVWALFLLLGGSRSRSEEFVPQIIDHPSDLVVRWDQPATLNCRATGNPAPTIEWYHNGAYVKTSKEDATSQHTLLLDGSLFFLRLNQKKGKSDEGVYHCVARNHLGTATSRNASLYVEALQDDFRLHPSDLEVTAGEPLKLECTPPRGHPEPAISWKKNGVLINEENGHYKVSNTKLLVSRALKSDAGAYVCVASNQVGERLSRAARVSVLEKPTFTRRPSDVVAVLGSTVQFTCGTHGDPTPTIQWHKEYGDLPSGRYDISQENTLQIRLLTAYDAGKYVCTARNPVGTVAAKASLTLQDPLDTGQKERERSKDALKDLMGVRVYLANVSAVPSAPAAHLHWKVIPAPQHIEGYVVVFRSVLPVNTPWAEWNVPRDHRTIVPGLERGYKYEFKVRPYLGKVHGEDSNTRDLWIPEEVPSAAPQSINMLTFQDGNGTVIICWESPPPDMHNGIITGYQVWFLGNETHPGFNRTVDGGTHRLEATGLATGLKYCVQVAAMNGAGIGVASNPVCGAIEPAVGKMAKAPDFLSASYILDVVRQPVFIASVGSALWIMLMVLAVYVCQQQARQYSRRRQYALGEGLYRNASDDTIIKHRVDCTDSPWLSNTWKSTSGSKNYSSSSSLSSQLLWTDPKDSRDLHRSLMSVDRQSQSSHLQTVPLVPDSSNSSLYGALYVDLPAKDFRTFCNAPLPHLPNPGWPAVELAQTPDHRLVPRCGLNLRTDGAQNGRGATQPEPPKATVPLAPNLVPQGSWEKSGKKGKPRFLEALIELSAMFSATASPQHSSSTIRLFDSLEQPRQPSQWNPLWKAPQNQCHFKGLGRLSLKRVVHPVIGVKWFQELSDCWPRCTCTCYLEPPIDLEPQQQKQDAPQEARESSEDNPAAPTLPYSRLSAASISISLNDDRETVLTPEEVAEYLELSEEAESQRHQSESVPGSTRAASPPHTYGYICGPLALQLLETATVEDDDDDPNLREDDCRSAKYFRGFCRTPSSSLSEDEASLGGSLLNGWGSVSEDNGTSTRCSLVSSSDGSFLLDANFAQALAVAVDSFCFGLTHREVDKALTDFLPAASPLEAALRPPASSESSEEAEQKPRQPPLPVWEWSTAWVDELEAKFMPPEENGTAAPKPGEGRTATLGETLQCISGVQRANGK